MKRFFIGIVFLLFPFLIRGQEVITFMPQWTPQTQFAGYYVAIEKGFYEEEGVSVVLDHFGAKLAKIMHYAL